MYTQEQLQQSMALAGLKQLGYNENSANEARTKWLDARDKLQEAINARNTDAILQWRQAEHDTKLALDDAIQHSSHLVAAKQLNDQVVERKKQEDEAQKQHADQEKAKYREAAKGRYLAAGGTEDQFNHAFTDLWNRELMRRTEQGQNPMEEQMKARYEGTAI
jgi:hypothetical protein